jgi:hypothetical protein
MAAIARYHAEWLSLMDVSGPFLSVPVLSEVFPNGLVSHDAVIAVELRAAYDDWSDPAGAGYADSDAVHRAFVDFVLHRVLGLRGDDIVRDAESLKADFSAGMSTPTVTLVPDAVIMVRGAPGLLVTILPRSVAPDQPVPGDEWTATPRERMVEMLRGTECPLGLVTDGERWTLVSRRDGEAPGYATWWASLWREERITLQSFRTLLGEDRFFSAPDEETLVGLLERSAQDQSEVTTQLGNQTLEAVEILVRRLDQLDRDRGGDLLKDIPEPELYDAAVTVMMRLVFLFFAEENDLLPMNEDLWQTEYAASSLRARLQKAADESGEEVLEAHSDAWPRLLATWRAVHGGVEHGDMRLAPYGGSLFDPDRYPFLEGRLPGSSWGEADPLPVDNRTVLHLLSALQTLQEAGQKRKLSFLALDVEQIGHVYEGMLDHTAARAKGWVLGLSGTGGKEPEIPLEELEALDRDDLVMLLSDRTGRSAATVETWLDVDAAEEVKNRFGTHWAPAFAGDSDAAARVQHLGKFIRTASVGGPTVFQPGSVYVCDSSHRGATGTHYTPRSFTVEMVQSTLDPMVYEGIAEGKPESEWRLRTPEEILSLKVGDPACGSGAFLVQACRYLSAKLVESRRIHGELDHDPTEDDLIQARREVAGRCLYGVDLNPMAAEMAKLSLWLVTLERDKPFSFLDHAIGVGDSLVGLTDLDQLRHWSLSGQGDTQDWITGMVGEGVEQALELRRKLESAPVIDIQDVENKRRLLEEARHSTRRLSALADLLFAPSLGSDSASDVEQRRDAARNFATHHLSASEALANEAERVLDGVSLFHWVLEFPEVFQRGGFDAIVGNPPFLGGSAITGVFGVPYREYVVGAVAHGCRGKADLAVYFFLRSFALLRSRAAFGLLGRQSISQGESRAVGLDQIAAWGGTIFSAWADESWPNDASVRTSRIHVWKGVWRGGPRLDGKPVPRISTSLTTATHEVPRVLESNPKLTFEGSKPNGDFFLEPEVARKLLASKPKYSVALLPYLTGDDLNNDPFQRPTRYAICFWDWTEDQARKFAELYDVVEKRVKPIRQRRDEQGNFQLRRPLPELWWVYSEKRPALYHAIGRGHSFNDHPEDWDPKTPSPDRVIVATRVSKYWQPFLVPNRYVFSDRLVVFGTGRRDVFGLLTSSVHRVWAWDRRSSHGVASSLTYVASSAFMTFPGPDRTFFNMDEELTALGEQFAAALSSATTKRRQGLTSLLNDLHDPSVDDSDICALRSLQVRIDDRVLAIYGWEDVDLDHSFHDVAYLPDNDRLRFTISEEARLKILDRLGSLNRQRYEQEVAEGLHDQKKRGSKSKAGTKKTAKTARATASDFQEGLFGEGDGSQ